MNFLRSFFFFPRISSAIMIHMLEFGLILASMACSSLVAIAVTTPFPGSPQRETLGTRLSTYVKVGSLCLL